MLSDDRLDALFGSVADRSTFEPPSRPPEDTRGVWDRTTGNFDDLLDAAADKHGIDRRLVRALRDVESSGNPRAVSSKGAMGLMQVMPGTAKEMGYQPQDMFDPAANIDAGVGYLGKMLDRANGDVVTALRMYNAGPNANLNRINNQGYADKIMSRVPRYNGLGEGSFSRGFGAGLAGTASDWYAEGARRALREGNLEEAQRLMLEARQGQRYIADDARPQDQITNIEGLGDIPNALRYNFGQGVASTLPAALGYAGAGAAVGSMLPGVGTALGGALGLGYGLMHQYAGNTLSGATNERMQHSTLPGSEEDRVAQALNSMSPQDLNRIEAAGAARGMLEAGADVALGGLGKIVRMGNPVDLLAKPFSKVGAGMVSEAGQEMADVPLESWGTGGDYTGKDLLNAGFGGAVGGGGMIAATSPVGVGIQARGLFDPAYRPDYNRYATRAGMTQPSVPLMPDEYTSQFYTDRDVRDATRGELPSMYDPAASGQAAGAAPDYGKLTPAAEPPAPPPDPLADLNALEALVPTAFDPKKKGEPPKQLSFPEFKSRVQAARTAAAKDITDDDIAAYNEATKDLDDAAKPKLADFKKSQMGEDPKDPQILKAYTQYRALWDAGHRSFTAAKEQAKVDSFVGPQDLVGPRDPGTAPVFRDKATGQSDLFGATYGKDPKRLQDPTQYRTVGKGILPIPQNAPSVAAPPVGEQVDMFGVPLALTDESVATAEARARQESSPYEQAAWQRLADSRAEQRRGYAGAGQLDMFPDDSLPRRFSIPREYEDPNAKFAVNNAPLPGNRDIDELVAEQAREASAQPIRQRREAAVSAQDLAQKTQAAVRDDQIGAGLGQGRTERQRDVVRETQRALDAAERQRPKVAPPDNAPTPLEQVSQDVLRLEQDRAEALQRLNEARDEGASTRELNRFNQELNAITNQLVKAKKQRTRLEEERDRTVQAEIAAGRQVTNDIARPPNSPVDPRYIRAGARRTDILRSLKNGLRAPWIGKAGRKAASGRITQLINKGTIEPGEWSVVALPGSPKSAPYYVIRKDQETPDETTVQEAQPTADTAAQEAGVANATGNTAGAAAKDSGVTGGTPGTSRGKRGSRRRPVLDGRRPESRGTAGSPEQRATPTGEPATDAQSEPALKSSNIIETDFFDDQGSESPDDIGRETGIEFRENRVIRNPDADTGVLDNADFDGVKDGEALLTRFLRAAQNTDLKALSELLLSSPLLKDVRVRFLSAEDRINPFIAQHFNRGAGAVTAVSDTNVVMYFRKGKIREDEVVHETLHALTLAALERNPVLKQELRGVAKGVESSLVDLNLSKDPKANQLLGFWREAVRDGDPAELLAYALTSPTFREHLSQYGVDGKPFTAYRTDADLNAIRVNPNRPQVFRQAAPNKPTLWQKLVDLFRRLFRLPAKYQSQYEQALNKYLDARAQYEQDTKEYRTLKPLLGRLEADLRTLLEDTNQKGLLLIQGEEAKDSLTDAETKEQLFSALDKPWEGMKEWFVQAHKLPLLAEWFSELPALKDISKLEVEMQKTYDTLVDKVSSRVEDILSLDADVQAKLSKLMLDSTLWRIHPDAGFQVGSNDHLQAKDKAHYDEVRQAWDALPAEARKIYQQMRDTFQEQFDLRQKALSELAQKYMGAKAARRFARNLNILRKQSPGPYFPLVRFGEHVAVWKSKDLLQAEQDEDLPKIAQLRQDENHYKVDFFDSERQALNQLNAWIKEGGDRTAPAGEPDDRFQGSHYTRRAPFIQGLNSGMTGLLDKMGQSLDNTFSSSAEKEAAKNALAEAFLSSLPDSSIFRSAMKRESIAGVKPEQMVQALAFHGGSQAFHISRLTHADDLQKAMERLKRQDAAAVMKGSKLSTYGPLSQIFVNSFASDAPSGFGKAMQKLTGASYYMTLATKPAFWLINAATPATTVIPWLAGRHSIGKGYTEWWKAMTDVFPILTPKSIKDYLRFSFTDAFQNSKLAPDEKKMLAAVAEAGAIDQSQIRELTQVAQGQRGKMDTAMRFLGGMAHRAEVLSRAASALTAYRLEKERTKSEDAATQYAIEAVNDMMVNYSMAHAPLIFRRGGKLGSPAAKMIFQYARYSASIGQELVHLARKWKNGDEEAKRQFLTLMAVNTLMAGTNGWLGAEAIKFAVETVANWFLPDDDELDIDAEVKKIMDKHFGKTLSLAARRGLPALTGLDLSESLGFQKVFNIRSESPFSAETKDEFALKLMSSAPAVGWALNIYDYIKNPDSKRVPISIVANVAKAIEQGQHGMVSRNGITKIEPEEYSTVDLILQGLGLLPTINAEGYQVQNSERIAKKHVAATKQELLRDYHVALKRKDGAAAREVMAKIKAFQSRHPGDKEARIDQRTIQKSERQRRQREESMNEYGVEQ